MSAASAHINNYSKLTSALDEQQKGLRDFAPPLNNALKSASVLDVFFLGDARERPPSSGEPWTSDEYARLVRLTVRYPVTTEHRWKEISYALAINPDPDDLQLREVKNKDQERLIEKNKDKKNPEDVIMEKCYYCHGCGNKNELTSKACESCATPWVTRSPEECFLQLPILYYNYKDKVLKMDDEVIMGQRIGTLFEPYTPDMGKEVSQKERAERNLYDEEYNYGEFGLQTFNKLIQRCKRIFGHMPEGQNGVFWDLGCGSGKLVVAAATLHPFTQCWGIDYLRNLTLVGDQMIKTFEGSENYNNERDYYRDITCRVVCSDLSESDAWVDNTTVILCHATCFSDEMMDRICEKARGMNVGTLFITVTKPLPDDKLWFRIGEDEAEMHWGLGFCKAKIYFHEKIKIG
ncbi:hypothetical protein TrLO_g2362 [Triparma laevis f. longispina]|uniref:Histone-lysine N-methyltransferase, H3 lysine-79 specific n=1 Tax=Triparma laevis f. longispina TaxID=1714387 RepID=A0A9W7FDF2_9STRA|nr:hypothetical protein TrLO_g2362 [Triparma laevis f. longispina]